MTPGHDRVGVSARDHRGGEVIAILVDHALAIAEQVAFPLQTLIEELGVDRIALRQASVVNLDARVRKIETRRLGDAAHALFPANQNRLAKALIDEGISGADHLLFFAFREHHAFGRAADALDDELHCACDRVAARGQLRLVSLEIDDRPPRHRGGHCGLGHGDRHDMNEARIERNRNDVVAAEARPCPAISGGHLVGNVLAREVGERMRRGDLHFHVDRLGAHIEGAAEDIGKSEDVIDLVRIVGAAGGDDHVVTRLLRVFRRDLRIGIRHGENDRIGRHALDHFGSQRALG